MSAPERPAVSADQAVADALRLLDAAAKRSEGVQRDPLLPMYLALRAFLFGLHRLLTQASATFIDGINRSRHPLSDEDRQMLAKDAAALAYQFKLRTWILAGVIAIGVQILLLAGVAFACIQIGRGMGIADTAAFHSMSSAQAGEWLRLMNSNHDVTSAVDSCGKTAPSVTTPDGRRACSVPLFLDPQGSKP